MEALLPTVISLVIVILAQSAATSRAYAMKYADSFDENVDLVGLGAANLGAALTGTFVVNGSPTKTEMVDSAGGRTQIAQLTAAALVVVVLLFLTVPLSYMPNAVLASVVFLIGIRLIDVKGMKDIYRLRKGEFAVAAITAAVVVVVGVEQGILLAMALSIVEHIYHSYRPYDTLIVDYGRARPDDGPDRGRRPDRPRPRGLPLRRGPVLRQRRALHRGDHGHRGAGRSPAAHAGHHGILRWPTSTTPGRTHCARSTRSSGARA